MRKKNIFKLFVVLIVSSILASNIIPVMAEQKFNTNLKNLKQISGQWTQETDGFRGVGMDGDVFAMSETEGTDFVYETKVHRNEGVAFSLVFRSNEDGSEAYVANIDFDRNTARIFFFGNGGGDIGESYELPDPEETDFKLRLEVIGDSFRYFVNDILAVSASDDKYTSGLFGLLVYRGDGVFQDLIQKPITKETTPKLTGLEIKGMKDVFTYKDDTYEFTAKVPVGTDSINLIPKFENCEVTIGAYDASEKVVLNDTKVSSDGESPAIPISNKKVIVVLKIKGQEADITKTIEITQEAAPATTAPAKTTAPVKTTVSGTGTASTAPTDDTEGDNDLLGIIIGIAAAVVVIGGVAIFVIIKKKKK